MDRVEDWIVDFYIKHTVRCPREDWPEAGTEDESTTIFAWRHAFVTRGVEYRFADVASLDMAGDPPRFLNEHLPTIVKLAIEMRLREDSGPKADPLASPEAAKVASRDCPDCSGSGFALRYVHPEIHGKVKTVGGHVAPVGTGVSYPCSCPLGQLAARGLQPENSPRAVLTVDQYPSLRMGRVSWSDSPDNRYRHRPDAWDREWDMPAGAGEVMDVAGLKAAVRSLEASKHHEGRFVPPRPRTPQEWDARAVPDRSDAGDSIPDRVLESARPRPATPPTPEDFTIPEDYVAY